MIASNLTFFGDCKVEHSSACDSVGGRVGSFYKQLCVSVWDLHLSRRPLWRSIGNIGWKEDAGGDLPSGRILSGTPVFACLGWAHLHN